MGSEMISLEVLRELYDYNYWARDRQLEACAKLSEEQFLRPIGTSFGSLRDTLVHLLGAEWIWEERFRGGSPRNIPVWLQELRTVGAIRERWAAVERDLRTFVAALSTDALTRPLSYVNLQGQPWTYPLWQALLHLANHQTYHRGQVTTLLRQLGAVAAPVDFLVYFDEGKR